MPFEPESEAIFAAFTTPADAARKIVIDTLVLGLKNAGLWDKLALLYLIAAADAQAATINWKSPSTFTLNPVNAPTFTTDRGFTGNGTTSYLDTTWDPSNNGGGVYTQNSAHIGVYVTSDGNGANNIGRTSAGVPVLINTTGTCRVNNGSGGADGSLGGNPGNGGIWHVMCNRSASNALQVYKNASHWATATTASASLDTEDIFIGRAATGFSTDRHGAMHAGASLTLSEAEALYTLLNAYMASVGADLDLMMHGGWSWFSARRGVVVSGEMAMAVTTDQGNWAILREGRPPRMLGFNGGTVDDHNNPVLLKRASDSRYVVHYMGHGETFYRQRISTNADDLDFWGAETNLDTSLGSDQYSYGHLIEITDGLFALMRCGANSNEWRPRYSTSADGGATWAAATEILQDGTNRPYIRYVKTGANRFDACVSPHPGEVTGSSVYHFYYDAGTWRDSAGNDLGALPLEYADLTEVYDGSTTEAWIWDIAFDTVPVIVFAVFNNVLTDHRYRYAKWNGSSWDNYEICTAGATIDPEEQTNYSGGICIDPDDINTIYCSRETSGTFQIWRGVTADGGQTWTMTQLTFGAEDCIRPNKEAGSSLLSFMRGTYTHYTDFGTDIVNLDVSVQVLPGQAVVASDGGSSGRAAKQPWWSRSYNEQWLQELQEREREHERLKQITPEEIAERAELARVNAEARREQQAREAAEVAAAAAEERRLAERHATRQMGRILAARDAERERDGDRINVALRRAAYRRDGNGR